MNVSMEDFVTGGNGCLMVSSSSGAVTGKNFYAFQVNEAAVVTALIDGTGTDVLDTYKLQGITLSAGLLIVANAGSYFTGITLSSGSVLLLKR